MPVKKRVALLFFPILIILTAAVLYLFVKNSTGSKAILQASQNKFSLKFEIKEKDKENTKEFLENANLAANLTNGVTFELDATSSAALTFALPAQANLTIGSKDLSFIGKYQGPVLTTFQLEEIKIPTSTNLAMVGSSLPKFLESQFNIPMKLNSKGPVYLIVFGQKPEWAILIRNSDREAMSAQKLGLAAESLKEEEYDDQLKLNLIKTKNDRGEEVALAYFSFDNWTYLTSSRASAESMIKISRNQEESNPLKLKSPNANTAFALTFDNKDANDNFFSLVFSGKPSFSENIKKIKHLEFSLRKDSFSGLIELK